MSGPEISLGGIGGFEAGGGFTSSISGILAPSLEGPGSFGPSFVPEGPISLAGFEPMTAPIGGPYLGGVPGSISELNVASRIDGFGAELPAPSLPVISEKPARSFFWEDFRLMNTNDVQAPNVGGAFKAGEITFNTQSEPEVNEVVLNETDVLAEAESILAQSQSEKVAQDFGVAQDVEPATGQAPVVFSQIEARIDPVVDNNLYDRTPYCHKLSEEAACQAIDRRTLRRSSTSTLLSPVVFSALEKQTETDASKEQLEEQLTEETATEKVVNHAQGEDEGEKVIKAKRKHVVDDKALARVLVEGKEAVIKAWEQARKLGIKFTGRLIRLPGQHPGNESEAVKGKGPDGSIPERQQAVENAGEFSSAAEAEDRIIKEAYDKPPVKIREEGRAVSDEDVKRVYMRHVIKPKAVIEFVTRIVKKKKFVPKDQRILEFPAHIQTAEKKIEDLGLAEVLWPKAA